MKSALRHCVIPGSELFESLALHVPNRVPLVVVLGLRHVDELVVAALHVATNLIIVTHQPNADTLFNELLESRGGDSRGRCVRRLLLLLFSCVYVHLAFRLYSFFVLLLIVREPTCIPDSI